MTANLERAYVLDTHSLIWWLTEDRKLSSRALEIIEAAQRRETLLIVSAISIAEMYYWNRKSRSLDFDRTMADLRSRPYFEWRAFTADNALELDDDAPIPEMHDRIIAGLARRLKAPLVTRDPQIRPVGDLRVVW